MHTTARRWRPVVHCMRAMKKLKSTAAVHRLPSRYTKVHRTAGRSAAQVHHCGFYLHDSATDTSIGCPRECERSMNKTICRRATRRGYQGIRPLFFAQPCAWIARWHRSSPVRFDPRFPPRRRSRTLTFILRSRSQRSSRDTIDPYADFMAIHTPRSSLKALPPDFKSETGVPGDRLDACILDPLA